VGRFKDKLAGTAGVLVGEDVKRVVEALREKILDQQATQIKKQQAVERAYEAIEREHVSRRRRFMTLQETRAWLREKIGVAANGVSEARLEEYRLTALGILDAQWQEFNTRTSLARRGLNYIEQEYYASHRKNSGLTQSHNAEYEKILDETYFAIITEEETLLYKAVIEKVIGEQPLRQGRRGIISLVRAHIVSFVTAGTIGMAGVLYYGYKSKILGWLASLVKIEGAFAGIKAVIIAHPVIATFVIISLVAAIILANKEIIQPLQMKDQAQENLLKIIKNISHRDGNTRNNKPLTTLLTIINWFSGIGVYFTPLVATVALLVGGIIGSEAALFIAGISIAVGIAALLVRIATGARQLRNRPAVAMKSSMRVAEAVIAGLLIMSGFSLLVGLGVSLSIVAAAGIATMISVVSLIYLIPRYIGNDKIIRHRLVIAGFALSIAAFALVAVLLSIFPMTFASAMTVVGISGMFAGLAKAGFSLEAGHYLVKKISQIRARLNKYSYRSENKAIRKANIVKSVLSVFREIVLSNILTIVFGGFILVGFFAAIKGGFLAAL
ncbi:MAG: hypothetical protein WBI28_06250, partial [Candidatus Omnitrophota bacterium]